MERSEAIAKLHKEIDTYLANVKKSKDGNLAVAYPMDVYNFEDLIKDIIKLKFEPDSKDEYPLEITIENNSVPFTYLDTGTEQFLLDSLERALHNLQAFRKLVKQYNALKNNTPKTRGTGRRIIVR